LIAPTTRLSSAAAAVIISGEFRNRAYPQADLSELFAEYQQRAQGLVVFTVGDDAILYGRRGQPIRQFKPYPVKVIDSAGAGDSFRAGVIYGLLQQWMMTKPSSTLRQSRGWCARASPAC
jgi:sugar/nucleoside kinase (ribokinase family)